MANLTNNPETDLSLAQIEEEDKQDIVATNEE